MALARLCLVAALSGALALWTFSNADAAATDWVGDGHAAVRLITATDSLATAPALDAALEFRFGKGWHGYWRTPGDAGIAPAIDWSGSDNIAGGEVAWPAPHRLVIEGLQNSVYEKQVVLPIKLSLKHTGLATGIRAMIAYAACSDVCVPYQAELSLSLPAGAGTISAEAFLIEAARRSVPGTAQAAGIDIVAVRIEGGASQPRLVVDLRSKNRPFVQPDLFVEGVGSGIPAAPEVEFHEGGKAAHLTVRLPAQPRSERPLTLTLTDGDRAAEFEFPAGTSRSAH
ncbi:MAG: protein-disulfide reductase DsbD domain-containing protein [Tardiphaga sp.]|jgi:suppressor for copper-sensitivity B